MGSGLLRGQWRTAIPVAASVFLLAAANADAGPKVYVGNFKDNTVSVIDTEAGRAIATVRVSAGPHGMAVSPDGRRLYVSGDASSALSVIDTASDRVVGNIEVGKSPHGLAFSSDGMTLLVAVNGEDRIAFVDTGKQAVTGTVPVPKPHTISIRPDGKEAYVTSQKPGAFALAVVDVPTRTVARTVPLDKTPRDLQVGYDGKEVYFTEAGVNAVEVLDPGTDRIIAEVPTGVSPHYVNLFPHTSFGMTVVQGPGELLLFDPATNRPVRHIGVGKQPHWLAVSGDGRTAFVTDEGSNDLSVVDLPSGKVRMIPVGNAPRKVAVQPTGADPKVSIANFAFVPQVITIVPGDSVTWSNDDGAPHGIAFKDGSPGSDSILPGKTFTRAFDRPGTYEYNCSIHNYMTGTVVVAPQ